MKKNISGYTKLFVLSLAVVVLACSCDFGLKKSVNVPANESPNPTTDKNEPDVEQGQNDDNPTDENSNSDEVKTDELDNNPIIESGASGSSGFKKPNNIEGSTNKGNDSSSNSSSSNIKQPSSSFNDPTLSNYWNMLDEVSAAAQSYYSENFSKTRVITKNGYLYNKAAEQKIDVDYLVANGYLTSRYINKGIEVLLLKSEDFDNIDGFKLKSVESGLTVFASIKHPAKNSYLLTTNKSAGGEISASQYASLLNGYYQNHGLVGKLNSDTETYGRILDFISMYESKYENYYVRSITTDNKYAMVVLSSQTSVSDLKQYVLRRNGSIWEVVLSGLESDPRVIITVNKALPDFNLTMIPAYTINDHKGSLSKDKSEVINTLIAKGHIENREKIKYICGTSNFCYIVLTNEVKYLANNKGDVWNIVQVASSDDAYKKMLAINKNAPTFIILDR